jgi:hypothetical protein
MMGINRPRCCRTNSHTGRLRANSASMASGDFNLNAGRRGLTLGEDWNP